MDSKVTDCDSIHTKRTVSECRDGEWMYGCQGGPRKEGDEEQWAQLLSWGDEKRMRWGYIEVVVAL